MMRLFAAMPLGTKEKPGVREAVRAASKMSNFFCVFPDEIEKSHKITQSIIDEIRRSSAVIAEISDQNPNVIWEYGFAASIGKPIIPIATSADALFFDNKDDRAIIYDPKSIELELIQRLALILHDIRSTRPSFPLTDLIGTAPYTRAAAVMGLETIGNSRMGIYELFEHAKKRVFTAAQNHWFIVNSMPRFKENLLRFLNKGGSRSFDLLMCDPAAECAVLAWQYVTGSVYKDHLERASQAFIELERWANATPTVSGRIRVRRVPFVPFSVIFVDPEEDDGLMVVTPNAYQPLNKPRPCFVVSRINGDSIFQQYYSAYSHMLEL